MAQGNYFDRFDRPTVAPDYIPPLPESPNERAERERDDAAAGRDDIRTGLSVQTYDRETGNIEFQQTTKLANDYNSDPIVRGYRVAIQQLGLALNTGAGPQADLALTYAFAKAMDPDSVVRDQEQGMIIESQPWFQSAVERARKQFGADGAGNFTPEARNALRQQIINAVAQRNKTYNARRAFYTDQAEHFEIDPGFVVGEHDGAPFRPALEQFDQRQSNDAKRRSELPGQENPFAGIVGEDGKPLGPDGGYGFDPQTGEWSMHGRVTAEPEAQKQSLIGQAASGLNTGIAGNMDMFDPLLGFAKIPATVAQAAGVDSPLVSQVANGQFWNNRFRDMGMIGADPTDSTGQFVRRVGQSVGASLIPVPGAGARGLATQAGMGVGGGIGAAAAQQAFPGSLPAEIAGEVLGAGSVSGAAARIGQNARQAAVNAAVPTVDQLKAQAGAIYQRAEQQGRAATPALTRRLFQQTRRLLRDQGQLGPNGSISDAPSSTIKAFNLISQYAGKRMTPTEMDTVRRVIAEGRDSADAADRRIAGLLLDQFDDWARPLVPDFDEARDVSSRYLQAQDLERARELARVNASNFTQSGYENALRTQYRALDRNTVNERAWFHPDVQQAVRRVNRGTFGSNVARALGKLAPTSVVSAGLGVGAPTALGGYLGGPVGALAAGTAAAGIGTAGRFAATRMGLNNAAQAELIARNGGNLAKVPLMDPATERAMLLASAGLLGQYPDPASAQQQEGAYYPNPFAGAEGQPQRRGLFGGLR